MHQTHIDLPEGDREKLVALLNARLADLIDLQTQLKQAHWNVKGPSAMVLHELFDRITAAVRAASDGVAERATALGGIAYGTVRVAAERSTLNEYPVDTADGLAHCRAVAFAIGRAGAHVRKAIGEAAEIGDAVTEDLLTQIARELDEKLWFVEAHLQADH